MAMIPSLGEALRGQQDNSYDWPPGVAGEVAGFIYQNAPRPVRAVAIVGALGFLAGICGRQWQVSDSGLNGYMILVARSAIGKEAMTSGVAALHNAVSRKALIPSFVEFSDMASGPALTKAVAANPCFVHVMSEFGETLRAMANDSPTGPMSGLRKVMMRLHSKSGAQDVAGGIRYSNQDNNVEAIGGAAYSMIGETTPANFYEGINSDLLTNGFMSRLTIIEYDGKRPPKNPSRLGHPSDDLINQLVPIAVHAQALLSRNEFINVELSPSAKASFDDFEALCDQEIDDAGDNESLRQMYNRGALKALRIASLLAVAENYLQPVIAVTQADWAIGIIQRDIGMFHDRLQSGDIGNDDRTRQQKLKAIIYEAIISGVPNGYRVPRGMLTNGVVPYSVLQKRAYQISAFTAPKAGANAMLKQTIQALVDGGYITELFAKDVVEQYQFRGKCYRIARPLDEFH